MNAFDIIHIPLALHYYKNAYVTICTASIVNKCYAGRRQVEKEVEM